MNRTDRDNLRVLPRPSLDPSDGNAELSRIRHLTCYLDRLALLDECDRLERERDEARAMVRTLNAKIDEDVVHVPAIIDDAIQRWDAEDAQAAKNDGG